MAYNVVLSKFEGPLDLLLHLIEKSKLSIYDINIAEITEQYNEYLNEMRKVDLEISSEFIVMAATLLEIKAKSLLPVADDENQQDDQDEKDELIYKLIEYKKFKQVCQQLREMESKASKVFYKEKSDLDDFRSQSVIIAPVELDQLYSSFRRASSAIKETFYSEQKFSYLKTKAFSTTKMVSKLKKMLRKYKKINFNKYFCKRLSKPEVIVSFLAILELAKKNKIHITQNKIFSNIIIQDKSKRGLEIGRK